MKLTIRRTNTKSCGPKKVYAATNTSGISPKPAMKLNRGSLNDMIDAFQSEIDNHEIETAIDISGGLFKILEDITDEIEAQLSSEVQDISFEHDDENLYITPYVVEQGQEIVVPLKDIIFDGSKIMENVDSIMKRIEEAIPELQK